MGDSSEPPSSPHHSTLTNALTASTARYHSTHPKSASAYASACQFMPGGNTRTVLHTSPFPLTIASASAAQLTTLDNQTYTDFLGEYTAGIYGHSHPAIKSAVEDALSKGWNYAGSCPAERELAQLVCERFSPVMDKVRFVNSGTEANMLAIGTAVACTGKKKILVFRGGYHGSTISGMVPVEGKPSINLPHEFVVGEYNDVQGTEELVGGLEGEGRESLAAILVEPMLGSGGGFAATKEFLLCLRELAIKTQAILIFDEVMTSRLGYRGLGEKMGVYPDMITLGKWVGGGMSFGCFGGRSYIMDLFDPRKGNLVHAGTFNNNVFSMHAGVAGVKLLDKRTLEKLNADGDALREGIEDVFLEKGLMKNHPAFFRYYIGGKVPSAPLTEEINDDAGHASRPPKMFVTGVGSIMVVQFGGPERGLLQGLFYQHMLEQGIYMAPRGFVALNIMLKDEDYTKFVQAVREFVERWVDALTW